MLLLTSKTPWVFCASLGALPCTTQQHTEPGKGEERTEGREVNLLPSFCTIRYRDAQNSCGPSPALQKRRLKGKEGDIVVPCDMQGDSKFFHRRERAGLVEGRDGDEEHGGLGDAEEIEMFLLACCDLPSGKELGAWRGWWGLFFPLVDFVSCLLDPQLYQLCIM